MNKITDVLLFVSIIAFSISCTEEIDTNALVTRQGKFYKVNSQKPFTGNAVLFYGNEQKMIQTPIKNGIVNGMLITWSKNGQKLSEGYSFDMKYNGVLTTWYSTGYVKDKITYSNNIKNGSFKEWYESGDIKTLGTYLDGEIDGMFSKWDENGCQILEVHYSRGLLNGKYVEWYNNGNIKTKCQYSAGILNGELKSWTEDGTLDTEGFYFNGEKEGMWSENLLRESGLYSEGKRIGKWIIMGSAVKLKDPLKLLPDIEQLYQEHFIEAKIMQLLKNKYPIYSGTYNHELSDSLFVKFPAYKDWLTPVGDRRQEVNY